MTTRPLSFGDILRMWERAESAVSASTRALGVLEVVLPDAEWESLSSMSVGRRDQRLLEVRERVVGSEMALCGDCPECRERVELALTTRELTTAAASVARDEEERPYRLEHGGVVIEFRLPDSADMDAAGLCDDLSAARQELLERCVLAATDATGRGLHGSELSVEVQSALEHEMDRLDPLAVTSVDLACPACGAHWTARVDVSDVVLHDLSAEAQTLLQDIAALAGHYHWSEDSILRMSARRRRRYLELAGQ